MATFEIITVPQIHLYKIFLPPQGFGPEAKTRGGIIVAARKQKKYLQYEYTVDITGRYLELAEMRPQMVSGVDDVSSF